MLLQTKRRFDFLGWQSTNGSRRLPFQQTCPFRTQEAQPEQRYSQNFASFLETKLLRPFVQGSRWALTDDIHFKVNSGRNNLHKNSAVLMKNNDQLLFDIKKCKSESTHWFNISAPHCLLFAVGLQLPIEVYYTNYSPTVHIFSSAFFYSWKSFLHIVFT